MLRCIPLFRSCNRQVEYIDKRHCSLSNVPDDVLRYARTLEELLLDANHIKDLPRGLFRLVKLRKLSLSDNEIYRIPPDIANLINLVEFDISKNDVSEIPENIKFLKSLQVADFSSNPIVKIPSGFSHLKNLTVLGLNDVSITQLPSDFGSLTNLQSLEVRDNILKTLPPSFTFLVKLERLDLGGNEFEELPPLIGQLTNLQELWVDCNELITLPPEIDNLKQLTCLDVSENRLEVLPEEIEGLENLTDLHLSQNCLDSLPVGIGELRKLTIFKVDQNRLPELTPAIGNCVNLQELVLTENLISELPSSIGNLVKLTNLNLDRNRLMELPPEIGNLTNLGVLSLRDNRLTYLPVETGNLKELHVLDVSGNRLQYLPISITALNLKALWLSENQSQPMLKFQTDEDERTGDKVLTCFLLPQQEYHTDSLENLLQNSTDQDSRLSWDQRGGERMSAVKFAEGSEDDKEERETQFVRHDTPHPRELKARHPKLFVHKGKNIDGHVASHEEKEDVVDSFRPQRASTGSAVSESSEASLQHPKEVTKGDVVQDGPPISSGRVAGLPQPRENRANSESSVEQDTHHGVLFSQNKEEVETQGQDEEVDSSSASDEENQLLLEGERRVGFTSDTEDQPERHNKLHRRDTPHHLKKKRINRANEKEDQEKVASILARALSKDEQKDQESIPTVHQPSDVRWNSGVTGTQTMIVSNSSDPINVVQEKLTINLHRTQAGLGLSIAGGKGSTPYKGDDESIFVSRVTEGGPAEKGGLQVGDRILSVNGVSLEMVNHFEAVDILKTIGNNITLEVIRESPVSQRIYTTLIRDHTGLGFSIAGGRGGEAYKEDCDGIYISRIADGGAASKDGKLKVGDKVLSINGVDMDSARHDQAVAMLTGLERFVRLVVLREQVVLKDSNNPKDPEKSQSNSQKSPKVFGRPRPYTGFYSSSSYMANRPSYTGSYKRPDISPGGEADAKPTYSIFTKLPGLRNETTGTVSSSLASAPTYLGSPVNTTSTSTIHNSHHTVSRSFSEQIPVASGNTIQAHHQSNSQKSPAELGLPIHFSDPAHINSTICVVSKGTIPTSTPNHLNFNTAVSQNFETQKHLRKANSLDVAIETLPAHRNNNPVCVSTSLEEDVTLVKAGGPLGLSIIGGSDHSCHPFGAVEPGIFISRIVSDGAAAKTGKLRIGDRILKVNGSDIRKATHQEAVMALLSPVEQMKLTVYHEPLPSGWQELKIEKKPGEKLGMTIKGGTKGHPGNPLDKEDEGVFISKINSTGAVYRDGRLKPGTRIIEVNGISLLGASHQEAVNVLRNAGDTIKLLICDGYDPAAVANTIQHDDNKPGNRVSVMSVSSIDRDDEDMLILRQEQETLREAAEWEKEDKEKANQSRQDKLQDEDTRSFQTPPLDGAMVTSLNIVDQDKVSAELPGIVKQSPVVEDIDNPVYQREPKPDVSDSFINTTLFSVHQTSTPLGCKNPPTHTSYPPIPPKPLILDTSDLNSSNSSSSVVDPIGFSRLPGAKPPIAPRPKNFEKKVNDGNPERLTFSEKKRRFEQDTGPTSSSETKHFSYLSEDEINKMQEEEERKMASMTRDQLHSFHLLEDEEEDEDEEDIRRMNSYGQDEVDRFLSVQDKTRKTQPIFCRVQESPGCPASPLFCDNQEEGNCVVIHTLENYKESSDKHNEKVNLMAENMLSLELQGEDDKERSNGLTEDCSTSEPQSPLTENESNIISTANHKSGSPGKKKKKKRSKK
ncbi:protein lap4-like isoform X2 [Tachypleus tridentatus]|uniref:protein lap4-like isoform X2 n=1 Tax=Tachypleus tridentatus TaxID=6853 RepID=UPI003FCFDBF9